MIPFTLKCPFCKTNDDWHERHEHSFECGSCEAIQHRCDASSPWEFVSPKTRRAVRRAEASVRDAFSEDE